MKQTLLVICIALSFPMATLAAPIIFPPIDEGVKDPSFVDFRTAMLNAAKAKDTDAIIAMSAPEIKLSFGGDAGHGAMRQFFNDPNYDMWSELITLLELGGTLEGDEFIAPYTFTAETPPHYDPFETFFVMGTDVLLRNAPEKSATAMNVISHAAVQVLEWDHDSEYQRITIPEAPEFTGLYINSDFLRSAIDYRAIFSKVSGDWEMTVLIAGD